MRHRLWHRIFVSLLLFVSLALLLSALASHLLLAQVVRTHVLEDLGARARAVGRGLPGADAPPDRLQHALEALASEQRVQAALWSADGRRLAFTTVDLPRPVRGAVEPDFAAGRRDAALALVLDDGRALVVRPSQVPRPFAFLLAVAFLAGLLAFASHPVARRITRRLEALEAGVRRFGEGELATRVAVGGRDELAELATSFNRTAERLQRLVEAQRRVLASASHELRSPLARLRLALELSRDDPAAARDRLDEAVAEVAELDSLVEDLLLAGRLEVQEGAPGAEAVALDALAAEEAARTGAAVRTTPTVVTGDGRVLRVLLRNLVENARRHGGGAVEVEVGPLPARPGGAVVRVSDRGPGVPEGERERIFEPFYRPPGHAEGHDGGVGLGLYLARRIAERHGGGIRCLPREGGGTVFEVVLHAGPGGGVAPAPAP